MDRKEAIERLFYLKSKAENALINSNSYCDWLINDVKGTINAFSMAIEALQEPERKKGQWIILSSNEDSAVCKCSVCGEDFIFYNGEFFPNYCGDCGSDMRGEEE